MLTPRRTFVAFAIAAAMIGGSAASRSRHNPPSDTPPQKATESERASSTDKRGTPEQPLSVNVVPTTEQQAGTREEKASAELKAADDRELVKYTGYLVLVGIVQLGVFVLQLIAFVAQAIFMRRTVTEMQSTTGAAIRAAKAAEDTVGHVRDTAKRQLRAYVHVVDATILDANSKWPPNIRIRFKNYGQTPAYKVSTCCSYIMSLTKEPVFPTETITRYSDLGPSQDQITAIIIPLALWDGIKGRVAPFFVFGQITYFDTFQDRISEDPHITRYRCQLEIAADDVPYFIISDEGNSSD